MKKESCINGRQRVAFEDLIKQYQDIRKEHGDAAKNSQWMSDNGYAGLISGVYRNKLNWLEFRNECGFDDEPFRKKVLTINALIDKYKEIRREHGDVAKSSSWMTDNGYNRVYRQARDNHG